MKRRDDLVTASEIASWAWCPESWRLKAVGHQPTNLADLERGERHHAIKAAFEERSRSTTSVGWVLLVVAVLVALAAFLALVLAGEA